MKTKIKSSEIEKYMLKDPKVRRVIARQSHFMFFNYYFADYIKYKTALFQKQMFNLTQNEKIKASVITAFRGSAKSTIMSLSYPIWAIIGAQGKKHIIILSQTQQLCKMILTNIKAELEGNALLNSDFGPFRELAIEWSSNTLLINDYNCRISAISCGESMRGIRYKQHRPDLIIVDDVEDLASVRTREGREKTFKWLTRDIIPAGDINTKIIVVGNMLHEDGLMMRLKNAVQDGSFAAQYRQYPLLDDYGKCLWPGKFPNQESLDMLRSSLVSEAAWQREYLLKIVPEEDAVVLPEWIRYYDNINEYSEDLRYVAAALDPAISQNETAHLTGMVAAKIYHYGQDVKIYILPYIINKRLTFPQTVEQVKMLSDCINNGYPVRLFIEDVAYQKALIQELNRQGCHAEGVNLGQDKRARLTLTTQLLENGNILFPRKGCEELVT